MMAENDFYRHLFAGIDAFLENESADRVGDFLAYCAAHCSESYSRRVFVDNVNPDEPIERSLERLKAVFAGFSYKIAPDKITMFLAECGCDLVNDGFVRSPKLCACSEKSLRLNWEAVYGAGNVKVDKIATILEGNERCEFQIRIKRLGHADTALPSTENL